VAREWRPRNTPECHRSGDAGWDRLAALTSVDEPDSVATYYNRLGHWTAVARVVGYGGGRDTLTIHRALADPAAAGRPTTTRLHDVLIEALGPLSNPRVLDAGCGFGGTMIDLRHKVGGTFDGLTLSETQAATGRRAAARLGLRGTVRFHVQSYDSPPAGPFDLVIAIESLAHSANPAVSVAALTRVVTPGGRLVIVDDMPEDGDDAARDLATFKSGWQCPALWGALQYRQALVELGLQLTSDIDLTPSCRPRSLARIRQLERLNRAAHRLVPNAAWRRVLDSYHGGLALERLCRRGCVRYRLLVARRP
jgi:SAM-dependent methyltransferase